ncbi:hypothetical protein PO909_027037 [Leuciscus waleckii]
MLSRLDYHNSAGPLSGPQPSSYTSLPHSHTRLTQLLYHCCQSWSLIPKINLLSRASACFTVALTDNKSQKRDRERERSSVCKGVVEPHPLPQTMGADGLQGGVNVGWGNTDICKKESERVWHFFLES